LSLGLRAATSDNVLVVYGDLVFNRDTLLNAEFNQSTVLIDDSQMFSKDAVGCTINADNNVEQFLYDLPNKWAQIAYLQGKELSLLKQAAWNRDKDRLFGFEILNEVVLKHGVIKSESPKNMKIIDIDCSKDLTHIKKVLS